MKQIRCQYSHLRSDDSFVDAEQQEDDKEDEADGEEQVVVQRGGEWQLKRHWIQQPLQCTDYRAHGIQSQNIAPDFRLRPQTSHHFCQSPFERLQICSS